MKVVHCPSIACGHMGKDLIYAKCVIWNKGWCGLSREGRCTRQLKSIFGNVGDCCKGSVSRQSGSKSVNGVKASIGDAVGTSGDSYIDTVERPFCMIETGFACREIPFP
jgi:hypothetical protein